MLRSKHVLGRTSLTYSLALGLSAFAQSSTEIPLYPVEEQPSKTAPVPERITYRLFGLDDRGFNRLVQDITIPTMTIYHPEKPRHRGAAVVICPGGGYRFLVVDREGGAYARYLQQQGITAVVLKYRLPQPSVTGNALPFSQQDALAAVQFLRAHAQEWGLDEHRIGIVGSSAGGHLAGSTAILGNATTNSRPDFVVLLYPVIFMDGPFVHQGSRERLLGSSPTAERLAEFSLERRARAGLPPFFIVHAMDDKVVPVDNSRLFAEALQKVGVPVELHLYETGGHGFSLGNNAETKQWPVQFLDWLDALP